MGNYNASNLVRSLFETPRFINIFFLPCSNKHGPVEANAVSKILLSDDEANKVLFLCTDYVCLYVYGIDVAQILNTELAEKEHITKVQPADVSCIRSSSILYHKPCVQEHQVPNLDYS